MVNLFLKKMIMEMFIFPKHKYITFKEELIYG